MPDVSENEIAFAVLQIAARQQNGIATFDQIRREMPSLVRLSTADTQPSPTRPNEQMWEQRVRNIKSHDQSEGNYIFEGYLEHVPDSGYRITDAGRRMLRSTN